MLENPRKMGPSSPNHGVSSGSRWRRRSSDIDGIWEYIELEADDSQKWVILRPGDSGGLRTPHRTKKQVYNVTKGIGFRRIITSDFRKGKWT
jgi:hypothetical protein